MICIRIPTNSHKENFKICCHFLFRNELIVSKKMNGFFPIGIPQDFFKSLDDLSLIHHKKKNDQYLNSSASSTEILHWRILLPSKLASTYLVFLNWRIPVGEAVDFSYSIASKVQILFWLHSNIFGPTCHAHPSTCLPRPKYYYVLWYSCPKYLSSPKIRA